MVRRALPILVVLSVAASACGGGGQTAQSPPPSASGPASPASPTAGPSGPRALPLSQVHIGLRKVATLDDPIAMAVRPDDPGLYVAEKTGRVVAIRSGQVAERPVLDLTGKLSLGNEQGLLGIAFSPDGRYLYADYTDTAGNTHVTQWAWGSDGAEPKSARAILFVHQPYTNHNGGQIAFGPDGDLYVGLGDGGSEGDPHHYGQDLGTDLAKILRIRPTPGGPHPYAVPGDNPFVGRSGARPEIWAYGLRNPWRFTFDMKTGDLWIGDVGQNTWEEIDFQRAGSKGGQNYGWSLTEGDHPYNGNTPPANWTRPIFEYSHLTGGCAVIGGDVYRGTDVRGLYGAYLFSDNCSGGITAFRTRDGHVVSERGMGVHVPSPSSFGEDGNGELYLMSLGDGGVYQVVGR
jgi:glucose/arabinose dehydrogenase